MTEIWYAAENQTNFFSKLNFLMANDNHLTLYFFLWI